MTTATLKRSAFFSIPLIGWVAHDIAHKGEENLWYALVLFLSLVAMAVMTWGLVALSLTALAMVPVMFVVLIRITLG